MTDLLAQVLLRMAGPGTDVDSPDHDAEDAGPFDRYPPEW